MTKPIFIFHVALFVFHLCLATAMLAQETAGEAQVTLQRHLVLVTGVGGTDEYDRKFASWRSKWLAAGKQAGWRVTAIDGSDSSGTSRQQLESHLHQANQVDELWLVMIGHGTFDGELAKFNLVGEDVTAGEVGGWLASRKQPTVIVNCASGSAPFITELMGQNRVIVTSTKSGYEMSFCYFGEYLADAISRQGIDLDKDRRTSLLEAVIVAAGKTAEFYESDSRLATEHALIEDNGDGLGTPVEWFRGIRVTKTAKDGTPPDGLRANQVFFALPDSDHQLSDKQVARRDSLEQQIESLRGQKSRLTEEQYYGQLEQIMLQLSELYQTPASEATGN